MAPNLDATTITRIEDALLEAGATLNGVYLRSLATKFNVSVQTIYRHKKRILAGKAPAARTGGQIRVITPHMDYAVEHLLGAQPWLYLDEIKQFLLEAYDVDVNLATVHRCLKRIEITRKKIRAIAAQRNEELRHAWLWAIQSFPMDYYIAVDESGSDERTGDRTYGYSKRGTPAAVQRFLQRRPRISLLAAYTTKGFIATATFQGTCNADLFENFMIDILLPLCNPFPAERSIVVVDNASIHHANKEAIETAYLRKGVFIKYLPPYSPDFNPIEESFNDLKGFIRRTYHQKKAQFDNYQGYLEWAIKETGTGSAAERRALKHFYNAGFRDSEGNLDS